MADQLITGTTLIEDKRNEATSVPIGSIIAWLKSFTNTPSIPSGWVECDGSVLSDSDSVYNGATLPDLNGDNQFTRGNSTSGGTGGSSTHSHNFGGTIAVQSGAGTTVASDTTPDLTSTSTLPLYYDVVWIMKIK